MTTTTHRSSHTRLLFAAAGIYLALLSAGCQSTGLSPNPVSMPDDRVILGAGDTIDIKFFYAPEMNDSQTIRPDGKITMQLIGEVSAQGRTPEELGQILTGLYLKAIERPQLSVIVRRLQSRGVYVSGAVLRPGRLEMPARLSLMEAIAMAGGFDPASAELSTVMVFRIENGEQRGFSVDLSGAIKGATTKPFYLHPLDMVHIPQTAIVRVDRWMEQHINRLIPQLPIRVTRITDTGAIEFDATDSR